MRAPPDLCLWLLLRLSESWGVCVVDQTVASVSLEQQGQEGSVMPRTPEWMDDSLREHEEQIPLAPGLANRTVYALELPVYAQKRPAPPHSGVRPPTTHHPYQYRIQPPEIGPEGAPG
ncbi:hypothetical protein BDV93DRAFT_509496 [Ceratobasidium sp. AG-I]|nr:hypothetical protein BDV93DRAFT_509496 [Ceratobasidium sp. AG-I]